MTNRVDGQVVLANLLKLLVKLDIRAAFRLWTNHDPAAKMAMITALLQAGMINVDKAKKLLNF